MNINQLCLSDGAFPNEWDEHVITVVKTPTPEIYLQTTEKVIMLFLYPATIHDASERNYPTGFLDNLERCAEENENVRWCFAGIVVSGVRVPNVFYAIVMKYHLPKFL